MMRVSRRALYCLVAIATAAPGFAQTTHIVEIRNFAFDPPELTIAPGDTVQWNVTSGTHSTTSGNGCGAPNGLWDSGLLDPGQSFSLTFNSIPATCALDDSPGSNTCSYYCLPHCSSMQGVITISDCAGGVIALDRVRPGALTAFTRYDFVFRGEGFTTNTKVRLRNTGTGNVQVFTCAQLGCSVLEGGTVYAFSARAPKAGNYCVAMEDCQGISNSRCGTIQPADPTEPAPRPLPQPEEHETAIR